MSTPEARANIEKLLEELIGLTLLMALRDHGEQGWELDTVIHYGGWEGDK